MLSTPTKNDATRSKHQVDFDLWARKAYWSPVEAAVLSFSEDPDDFQSRPPDEISQLLELPKLHHRIDDIERAQKASKKPFGLSPVEFLEWASSVELELPRKLKAAVERATGAQSDWHTKYEKERTRVNELERQIAEQQSIILSLKHRENVDRRRKLQKIVIGIAISEYQYQLNKPNPAAGKIAEVLKSVQDEHAMKGPPLSEIAVDEDTIRKRLAAAVRELSGDDDS